MLPCIPWQRKPITAGEIAAIEPVVLSQPQFSDLLRDKNRPIIVIGLGLEPEGPYTQLRQFAEALDAPVIDTPKSKGALSADHPLFRRYHRLDSDRSSL